MNTLLEKLNSEDLFFSKPGASESSIKAAEKILGLTFAPEYKDYLLRYSVASINGHELTGILEGTRLDVIIATEEERTDGIPPDLYVVEQTNIDGIVAWQDAKGNIYETQYGSEPSFVCQSLGEYI